MDDIELPEEGLVPCKAGCQAMTCSCTWDFQNCSAMKAPLHDPHELADDIDISILEARVSNVNVGDWVVESTWLHVIEA